MLHQLPPVGLSAVVMSPNASASPKASKLLSTCIAMPASSPPVAMTRTPATTPKANRSKKIGGVLGAVGEREEQAGTRTAATPGAEQPAEGLGEVAAEGVLLPRGLQRGEQHDDEHEVAGGRWSSR